MLYIRVLTVIHTPTNEYPSSGLDIVLGTMRFLSIYSTYIMLLYARNIIFFI